MKSTISITAAVSAVLLLAACGGNSDGSGSTGGSAGSGTAATGKVTFIQGVSGDPFYETMACGAKAEAQKLGIELSVQGATAWDVSLQTPLLASVVQAKPNVVFIAPNDSKGMIGPLKAATAAGVKVGLVDTTLTDTSFASFGIATDNVAAGAAAADAMATLVGNKGSVLIAGLVPGVTTSEDRAKGFIDQLKKYPDITYIGSVFTNTGGVSGISALVGAKIAATPNLAGVFAMAGDQSQGTANAIRAAGKVGKIQVMGFDAGPAQVEQLKAGIVQGLVAQDPADIGKQAVDNAAALIKGETVPKLSGAPSTVITKDNVDQPDTAKYLYTTKCS